MQPAHTGLPVQDAGSSTSSGGSGQALNIISEITTGLATENDLEALLERFLGPIVRLAGASAGAVRALADDSSHMRLIGALGLPPDVIHDEQLVERHCGVCGSAAGSGTVQWANDLSVCAQRSAGGYFGQACKRVIAVPLQHKGRVLGVYNLFFDTDRDIAPEVASLLRFIGEVLGLALDNARLVRENLRSTVMNERQMMANEVHDSLAQTLAYVKMRMTLLREAMAQHDDVRSFKYFSDVDQAVGNAYSSLREILAHFRYRMDAGGLLHALRAIVEGFHDKTGVVLELDNQVSDISLSVDQEVQVFHIVQEALANITRHAGATRARLVLAQLDGRYEITIEDDGAGIAVCASSRGGNSHFGIDIMKERARRLGGYIEVRGLPGQGTRVHLTFPAPIRVNETGR